MQKVVASTTLNLSAASPTSTEDCYKIRNPFILLINNVNFHTMPAPRGGAFADIENLFEFFRDSCFTSIVEYYDLRQDQMLELLENTRTNLALGGYRIITLLASTKNRRRVESEIELKFKKWNMLESICDSVRFPGFRNGQ